MIRSKYSVSADYHIIIVHFLDVYTPFVFTYTLCCPGACSVFSVNMCV